MKTKYDLIVVGAGPAGLMAAKTAGENGLKTALLERKTDIPKMRRTDGGNLNPVNEYMFGQTLTFNPAAKRISFPASGFSIKYDGPYRDVYGFDIFSPSGKRIMFGDREKQKKDPDNNRVGYSLNKEILLKGLLEDAEANNVDIFPGTNVTAIEKKDNGLKVTGNGEPFEGHFVIAADGANSRIARLMGLNKERTFFATYQDYSWIVKDVEIPEIESVAFVLTGYGTFSIMSVSLKNHYHVGVSSFKPFQEDLVAMLNRFVHEDPVYSRWFKGGKKTGENACVVSMLSPVKDPFKDNVLLIGDAAWLQEISNVGAICCGWKAANAVTLAHLDGKINQEGVSSYLQWWEKYFYGPYGHMEFKPITIQDFLNADDIDYLVGLIKEPLEKTLNFYKLFGFVGETYGPLFPVIQEERPDVMDKMMGLVNRMDEIEKQAQKAGFPNR
jgi:digeranylgeranylglycerophospholipid reductase